MTFQNYIDERKKSLGKTCFERNTKLLEAEVAVFKEAGLTLEDKVEIFIQTLFPGTKRCEFPKEGWVIDCSLFELTVLYKDEVAKEAFSWPESLKQMERKSYK